MGGVAAAISNRYGIDPVVVRVALVALTLFSGFGFIAYLLGWLLFPAEDDEASAFEDFFGEGRSSMSKALTLALCLLLVLSVTWTFTRSWTAFGGFIGLAALYLLHHHRGHLNRPVPSILATTTSTTTHPRGATMTTTGTGSPVWDPLGAAPLSWHLPAPAPSAPEPPEPMPRRRRSPIGVATFGAALAVGGIGAALAAAGVPWFTPAHVIGLVLGVLGAGMVLGAFLGGGRGLIGLAIPLALAGLVLTNVPIRNFSSGVGPIEATPLTSEKVLPVYERTAGKIKLDLRRLEDSEPVETRLRAGAGKITVIVPQEADVTYTCDTNIGSLDCFGRQESGVGTGTVTGTDLGPDGEGGQKITLDASVATGSVEVQRG